MDGYEIFNPMLNVSKNMEVLLFKSRFDIGDIEFKQDQRIW